MATVREQIEQARREASTRRKVSPRTTTQNGARASIEQALEERAARERGPQRDAKKDFLAGIPEGLGQLVDAGMMGAEALIAKVSPDAARTFGANTPGPGSGMPSYEELARRGVEAVGLRDPGEGAFTEKFGQEVGAGSVLPGGTAVRGAVGAANIAGAAGSAIGRELTGDEGLMGAGGALAGGLAGSIASGLLAGIGLSLWRFRRHVTEVAEDVMSGAVSPARAMKQAEETVRVTVNDRNLALVELDRVEAIKAELPGFDPSTGAASADPGIRQLERNSVASPVGDGPTALTFEQARANGNRVVREELIKLRPIMGSEAEARAAVRSWIDRRMAEIPTAPNSVEASKAARAQYDALYKEFRETVGNQFDALEESARMRDVVLPTSALKQGLAKIRRRLGQSESLEIPGKVARVIDDADEMLSFHEIRSMERRINSELSKTDLSNSKIDQLTRLKESIDTALDNMGAPGAMKPTLEQTRALELMNRHMGRDPTLLHLAQWYRDTKAAWAEGMDRFTRGYGANLAAMRHGRPVTAVEETLDLFLKTGNEGAAAAKGFFEVYKDSPEVLLAMTDHIVNRALYGLVDEAGVIKVAGENASALRAFQRKYAEALKAFPAARARVHDIETIIKEAERVGVLGKPTSRQAVEGGALRLFVDDPSNAVNRIFKLDPLRQREAFNKLAHEMRNNPRALNGLRTVVMDEIIGRVVKHDVMVKIGTEPSLAVNARELQNVLIDSRIALQAIFPPEHLNRMDTLLEAAYVNQRQLSNLSARVTQTTVPNLLEKLQRSGWGNRLLSYRAQMLHGSTMASRIFRVLSNEEANNIIRRAANDYPLMRKLLSAATPKRAATFVEELRANTALGRNVPTTPFRAAVDEERASP